MFQVIFVSSNHFADKYAVDIYRRPRREAWHVCDVKYEWYGVIKICVTVGASGNKVGPHYDFRPVRSCSTQRSHYPFQKPFHSLQACLDDFDLVLPHYYCGDSLLLGAV